MRLSAPIPAHPKYARALIVSTDDWARLMFFDTSEALCCHADEDFYDFRKLLEAINGGDENSAHQQTALQKAKEFAQINFGVAETEWCVASNLDDPNELGGTFAPSIPLWPIWNYLRRRTCVWNHRIRLALCRLQHIIEQKDANNLIANALQATDDPCLVQVIRESQHSRCVNAVEVFDLNPQSVAQELIRIAYTERLRHWGPDPRNLFEDNRHKRARRIGVLLNEKGGFQLMQQVATSIAGALAASGDPHSTVSALEYCWDGIGTWRR